MGKEENKHKDILGTTTIPMGDLMLHYTEFRRVDPELMVKNTKIHNFEEKDRHLSWVEESGVRAILSVAEEQPNVIEYCLSLSGPEGETREKMITEFQKVFGNGVETFDWKSVSYQGVVSRDMYVWTALKV